MNEGGITYLDLYKAYLDCRKHKRSTMNAIAFEIDMENNLLDLLYEINNGTYRVGRSVAFIVNKPVKREIFAADFRDRIVHHLVIGKLNAIFERKFINDSYSCRVGRGTSFGIKRICRFVRSCSNNYKSDCYVLKLDVRGFFMHINREALYEKVKRCVESEYNEDDKKIVLSLCKLIIENDPTENCIFKGGIKEWNGLPRDKSLFFSAPNYGLPIGNLTSQVFANLYMSEFDHFVKHDLRIKYYGRYVDDFIIVHSNKEYLKKLVPTIRTYLDNRLSLKLHPHKIHLQHYAKGINFIGTVIMPYRKYVSRRTKSNLYDGIRRSNCLINNGVPQMSEIKHFVSSINSYFGVMKQYKTYKLRKKMFWLFSAYWYNYVYASGGYSKIVSKLKQNAQPL